MTQKLLVALFILSAGTAFAFSKEPITGRDRPRAGDSSEFAVRHISDSQMQVVVPDGATLDLVYIPGTTFVMGGLYKEGLEDFVYNALAFGSRHPMDEGPHRKTEISRGFFLGKTKVTVLLYCQFLNEQKDPERFLTQYRVKYERFLRVDGKYVPKEGYEQWAINTATWDGAVAFCAWLSAKTGKKFRLPREAEWELAAGGVSKRSHPWGNEDANPRQDYGIVEDAQIRQNFDYAVGTHPKNATPEGVYDLCGPVLEWCSDWYAPKYDRNDTKDPQGPRSGNLKVLRGEGVTARLKAVPNSKSGGYFNTGLRVVMEE